MSWIQIVGVVCLGWAGATAAALVLAKGLCQMAKGN